MSKPIHPTALFRLMVLGPLTSRTDIQRGEIKSIARELASKPYNIPDSKRTYISKETILRWYYEWKSLLHICSGISNNPYINQACPFVFLPKFQGEILFKF